jgi:hypothetical protein
VELTFGPYASQYASSSLTKCGRLMAPVSHRLTVGCEALATPNSVRRISAHVSMSCPACSRAARNRCRSPLPQATPTLGCSDTTTVWHTHIQGVYASYGYYAYVAYMTMATGAISGLLQRQTTGFSGHTGTGAPPEKANARYWNPESDADLTGSVASPDARRRGARRADSRPCWTTANALGPITSNVYTIEAPHLQNNRRVISRSIRPQVLRISTGCWPCRDWSMATVINRSALGAISCPQP